MFRHCSWVLLVLLASSVLAVPSSYARGFGGARGGSVRAGGAAVNRGGAVVGHYGGNVGGHVGVSGGYGTSARRTGTVVGPSGGVLSGSRGSNSYTTAGGTTIRYGGAGGSYRGPGGTTAGKAVGGVQVTTPGGQSYTKVGRASGAVGPGGNAVGSRQSIAVAQGNRGTAATISGGRTAIGPGGSLSTNYRGGVALGPHGAAAASQRRTVVAGSGGNAVAAQRTSAAAVRGHQTIRYSSTAVASQSRYIRTNCRHYNCFRSDWYRRYPGTWFAAGWAAGYAWRATTWPTLYSYCGYSAQPIYYDYGNTIVYYGDTVYYGGQPAATATQYAEQATQIAELGYQYPANANANTNESWQPLGVFALVQEGQQNSDRIFQLAINQAGAIRGNFYDALADTTYPVAGAVDRRTQRAAWSVAEKREVIFETGIANLTKDETALLVHYGTDSTQQMLLVRLQEQ